MTSSAAMAGATGTGGSTVERDAGHDAPVTCSAPEAPAHGRVVPRSLDLGGQADYTCEAGYGPPSSAMRTCQANGTWSGPTPTCPPVDCGKLEKPANGSVQVSATTFNSQATYACDPNHALSGNASRTCQANGTWSGTSPTCQCAGKVCNGTCVDLKTDNANCGSCGTVCSASPPATATCTPTGCLVTLTRAEAISSIAVDGANLYWTLNGTTGSVNKTPIGGGASTVLVSDQPFPGSLAVDANSVYWANANEETLRKVAIAGGTPTTLASQENGICCLALNSTHLYYLSNRGVNRILLAGGAPEIFVPPQGGISQYLALDPSNVYWRVDLLGGSKDSKLMKRSLDGNGAPTVLATQSTLRSIAADANNVYWTTSTDMESGAGRVSTMLRDGGETITLASELDGPQGIALDKEHVYWTCSRSGQVMRLPLAGGTPTVLATVKGTAGDMVIDAKSVYWLSYNAGDPLPGAVMKLTPR